MRITVPKTKYMKEMKEAFDVDSLKPQFNKDHDKDFEVMVN